MRNGDKCYSTCGEVFNYTDTDDFEVGDHCYEGEVRKIIPSELVHKWIVDDIMERMEESLYEEISDIADAQIGLSEDLENELLTCIKNFMDTHMKISCYAVDNIKEMVVE